MTSKSQKKKPETDKVEWVPPPYPKPAFKEHVWLEGIDQIMEKWVDDTPEGLDARKAKLQELLLKLSPGELYSRHFYLQDKQWVEWTTTKEQILNSYIYSLSVGASRRRLGIGLPYEKESH